MVGDVDGVPKVFGKHIALVGRATSASASQRNRLRNPSANPATRFTLFLSVAATPGLTSPRVRAITTGAASRSANLEPVLDVKGDGAITKRE